MHVLLTETVTPRARDAARSLECAGHVVHRCHGADDADSTCAALRGGSCPLEDHPIDLVVTVRPLGASRPTPLEDGVRCGVRRKIPLLVAGATHGDPWTAWERFVWPGVDLVEPVARATEAPLPEHSVVATQALPASLGATARVVRRDGYLKVAVAASAPVTRAAAQRAAVRIHRALRAVDPWARGIDVGVTTGGDR